MNQFEEFGLSKELLDTITKMGITQPTDIQRQSMPLIMAGKDVIGESATGSGKTLAFGCVIADKVLPEAGLQALVLTPTRELAHQVKESLMQISQHKRLRIVTVYGGVAIEPQMRSIPTANVVVATPGRLLDHLERKTIDISKIRILVLDEADRMFDMGFIEDVERIIRACPKQRQTLFFSATIPEEVRRLSSNYTLSPVKITAVRHVDPAKLKQVYYDVPRNMKLSLLVHLLRNEKSDLVMVFCNTRRTTDFVVKNLRANRINAIAIHGGLSQNKRSRTLEAFNDAKASVLVCTDVAARGLHIENVSHVYNYETPKDPKEYVHRIGRTARAGEEGKAVNLVCDFDYDNFSRVMSEHRTFNIEKMEKPYVERIIAERTEEERPGRPQWGARGGKEGYGRGREGYGRSQGRGEGYGRSRPSYNLDAIGAGGERRSQSYGRPGRHTPRGGRGRGESSQGGRHSPGTSPRHRGY